MSDSKPGFDWFRSSKTMFPCLHVTGKQLDAAYHWLCKHRIHYPADADIWWFRRHWMQAKTALLIAINSGEYRFSPLQKLCNENQQFLHVWSSQDALVLKILTGLLQTELDLSPPCTHIKGHGGLKQTVAEVQRQLPLYRFVCKTDVKGYYESIDHYTLLNQIADQVPHPLLRGYCYQVVRHSIEYGGNYQDIESGISRGCPLSPLLGALYLKKLDDLMSRQDVYYVRYMDDILILSKSRWQNRRVVKQLNQVFNELKIKQHPDKTFIGKLEKGFDFLGYRFSRKPLKLANITVKKHVERLHRLYEQQSKKASSEELALALGRYVQRWQRWCTAGLGCINLTLEPLFYELHPFLEDRLLAGR